MHTVAKIKMVKILKELTRLVLVSLYINQRNNVKCPLFPTVIVILIGMALILFSCLIRKHPVIWIKINLKLNMGWMATRKRVATHLMELVSGGQPNSLEVFSMSLWLKSRIEQKG